MYACGTRSKDNYKYISSLGSSKVAGADRLADDHRNALTLLYMQGDSNFAEDSYAINDAIENVPLMEDFIAAAKRYVLQQLNREDPDLRGNWSERVRAILSNWGAVTDMPLTQVMLEPLVCAEYHLFTDKDVLPAYTPRFGECDVITDMGNGILIGIKDGKLFEYSEEEVDA